MGANADSQPERLRVLTMLEQGKITAAECADLLDALAASPKTHGRDFGAKTRILAGALLVLCSFWLPWFTFHPGPQPPPPKPESVLGSDGRLKPMDLKPGPLDLMLMNLSRVIPLEEIMPKVMDESGKFQRGEIKESQYRLSFPGVMVKYGLSWWILGLSFAAGFICLGLRGIRGATQRNLAVSLLAIGAFLIFYLALLVPHYIGYGLLVLIAGNILEFSGALYLRHS